MEAKKYHLSLEWNDESQATATIIPDGTPGEQAGILMWIARGALMATSAKRSIIYNDEGFEVCAYIQD